MCLPDISLLVDALLLVDMLSLVDALSLVSVFFFGGWFSLSYNNTLEIDDLLENWQVRLN